MHSLTLLELMGAELIEAHVAPRTITKISDLAMPESRRYAQHEAQDAPFGSNPCQAA